MHQWYIVSPTGKVWTKHILTLLWKMVGNKFFLDSEHVGIGNAPSKIDCFY